MLCVILPAALIPASSAETALQQRWGEMFRMERKAGVWTQGDTFSHFHSNKNFEHLTFDIGNNKVLANVGPLGELKYLTIYRDSYRGASHPSGWSGVWTGKDSSSYGPYSFRLQMDGAGAPVDLSKVDWDVTTGLLDNIIPITTLTPPDHQFNVTLVTYAPLSADGSQRLRGVIYAARLTNTSPSQLRGKLILPELWAGKQNSNSAKLRWTQFDPYEFEIGLADATAFRKSREFDLAPGQSVWVPAILYMPGDPVITEVNAKGSLAWLDETWRYHRKLLGRMETPGNPWLGEFRERQILESLQSIAMSGAGKIAGSNWGSYPATRQIWIKDMYYSSLPLMSLEPELARKLILWFDENDIRHPGEIVKGGISHSVSLTVASVILASLHYEKTGDRKFFPDHPELRAKWNALLQAVADTRVNRDIWLFPTRFISDGALDCDYHTGSNIAVWKAFSGWSRILGEVYGDAAGARKWRDAASRVKSAILEKTVLDGRFVEGAYADGRQPLQIADGEESDTTLMAFYGFLPADDARYRKTMQFAISQANLIYQPKVRAISWASEPVSPLEKRVPSTAPGYLKGLAATGSFDEIRRVADADGSVWWWSYGGPSSAPEYGNVVRGVPGKSGWFAGAYSALFEARFAGVDYDAAARVLRVDPVESFTWSGAPGGFDVSVAKGRVTVKNNHGFAVTLVHGEKRVRVAPGVWGELR